MPRVHSSIEERFWSKVDKTSNPDGCWEWTAGRDSRGRYGKFGRRNGDAIGAHRYVMILAGHELGTADFVCHKCDNPPCVNPDHLYVGTHDDNMRDKVERDRCNKGVNVPTARLNPTTVLEVRALAASGVIHGEIARLYGITRTQVSKVARRDCWAWV